MKINVITHTFNAFQENTYVLADQDNNCVIIDAGCYDRSEQNVLLQFINDNSLIVKALLGTHAHIDHVLGNAFIKKTFECPYYLHENDLPTLKANEKYAHLYGFTGYERSPEPDILLQGGETLEFGGIHLKVLHTPGHCPGHVVYYNNENHFVINGDVLFKGSFGRVDLPGGNIEILKNSILTTMFNLPEETLVYCGHGSTTTIGKEKRSNYILNF